MADFLLQAGLVVLILGSSAWATSVYVRLAYFKCAACGNLNAKRRTECRVCGHSLDRR